MDAAPTTKTCKKCNEEKSLDEFYKSAKSKDGHKRVCKECDKARSKKYHKDNSEKIKEAARKWYKTNSTAALASVKKYQENNPEKIRATAKKYRENNPKKVKVRKNQWRVSNPEMVKASAKKWRKNNPEKRRADNEKWRKNNPEKRAANCASRRAAKLMRTPAWADLEAILEVYKQARALQVLTGIPFHVDHIVPLQGKTVSGLHVEYNLEPTPAIYNLIKHNTFDAG